MKATLLAYNINDSDKKTKLGRIFGFLGFRLVAVNKEMFNVPIGELVGTTKLEEREPYQGDELTEEMLVIGTDKEDDLNKALLLMRDEKISVALKAMITPNNQSWSGIDLYHEIKKEHEYMKKMEAERKQD
ncbi:MAG TPA: DUF3783 domain-containing protein [Candidatus Dorea intestinavium]|nr:DUF3783 domain-containing protein [Candidatus Dorea intestinavium]